MKFPKPNCGECEKRERGCNERCARWLTYEEAKKRWLKDKQGADEVYRYKRSNHLKRLRRRINGR